MQYFHGELREENTWVVALVGTHQMTEKFAVYLAGNGLTVVSGLAGDVDTVAHPSALKAGASLLAVLGSGVDRIYPPEHRGLANQIQGRGTLISDSPPGMLPDSANITPRNPIISGLWLAVVVTEAEQGREIFVAPGRILALKSQGSNRLLRDGARPLLEERELLGELNLARTHAKRLAQKAIPAAPSESRLLELIGTKTFQVDEIQARAGWSVEQATSALVMMELKGLVRQAGEMSDSVVRESDLLYNVGTSRKGNPASNEPT